MKRLEILQQIDDKNNLIKKLKEDITELHRKNYLLSDEHQQFKEEYEDVEVYPNNDRRKKPTIVKILVGRIYWKEWFKDESTGKVLEIERSSIVRKNGEWIIN